ncbi:hypothetical protein AMJ85_03660 [candidate division BRC1 bacterium SM23_51]|nr:MAG: hypothetical protein AMJ85_03660 [candidate division BRC1 bacterium SM23_51]
MDAKCSFCGRERNEVFTFFRPQDETQPSRADCIYICDRCIESCHKQLAAKRNHTIERVEKQQLREWLHESVTETLTRAIVDLKYRDALLTAFAERAQLAKIDPSEPPQPAALLLLPASFVRDNRILPWRIENDRLVVAFYNPLHLLDIYDQIAHLAGMPIRPALLDRDELLGAIERYLGPGE